MIDDNTSIQKHNGWHCCDLQPQGPRSRAFYYSRNSLLHTWITYYTELPMKVPITLHRLENPYNSPPPIAITGNRLTRWPLNASCLVNSLLLFSSALDCSSDLVPSVDCLSRPRSTALQCQRLVLDAPPSPMQPTPGFLQGAGTKINAVPVLLMQCDNAQPQPLTATQVCCPE